MIKKEEKWDHAVATGLHSINSTALAFGMEKLIQMINSSEGSKKKKMAHINLCIKYCLYCMYIQYTRMAMHAYVRYIVQGTYIYIFFWTFAFDFCM